MLSALLLARRKVMSDADHESNSIMASFLQFLEWQMTDSPQDLTAADAEQMSRICKLFKG